MLFILIMLATSLSSYSESAQIPFKLIGVSETDVKVLDNQGGEFYQLRIIKSSKIQNVLWRKDDVLDFRETFIYGAEIVSGYRMISGVSCAGDVSFVQVLAKLGRCTLGRSQEFRGIKWPKGTGVAFYPQYEGLLLGNAYLAEDLEVNGVKYKKGDSLHFNCETKSWEKGEKVLLDTNPEARGKKYPESCD